MHVADDLRPQTGEPLALVGSGLDEIPAGVGEVLGEEGVGVDVLRRHVDASVLPQPLLPRPVYVQLDPVAFRVVEVERLRHVVIAGSRVELRRMHGDGRQRCRQARGVRVQQRRVEQPCAATLTLRQVGSVVQGDQDVRSTARAPPSEADRRRPLLQHLQQQDVAVEPRHRVEIGHIQADATHRGIGWQQGGRRAHWSSKVVDSSTITHGRPIRTADSQWCSTHHTDPRTRVLLSRKHQPNRRQMESRPRFPLFEAPPVRRGL